LKYKIFENPKAKALKSKNYHYIFNKETGYFIRWGELMKDDPDMSPFGPEIADIEISEGKCSGNCKFCYKDNRETETRYMNLDKFKTILGSLKQTNSITQIAFGITDIDSNPDMWDIMRHSREQGVIPNITINGKRMTPEYYNKLAELCGAVAVSHYNDDECFNAIQEFSSRGMKQVNIHKVISEDSYDSCIELVNRVTEDPRAKGLNAIVFLALKPKGRGLHMKPLKDTQKYRELVELAMQKGVGIGFDSCSAPTFLKAMQGRKDYEKLEQLSEPCESMLFSIYINTAGEVYPCSFIEGQLGYKGIQITEDTDFIKDVWMHQDIVKWREKLLSTTKCDSCLVKGCRQCPEFDIY